jgi:hypothetical protein
MRMSRMIGATVRVMLSSALIERVEAQTALQEGFEQPNKLAWTLKPCDRPENSITWDTTLAASGRSSAALEERSPAPGPMKMVSTSCLGTGD